MFLMASFCLAMALLILRSSEEALSLISSSDKMQRSMFSERRGMATSSSIIESRYGIGGTSLPLVKEITLAAMFTL